MSYETFIEKLAQLSQQDHVRYSVEDDGLGKLYVDNHAMQALQTLVHVERVGRGDKLKPSQYLTGPFHFEIDPHTALTTGLDDADPAYAEMAKARVPALVDALSGAVELDYNPNPPVEPVLTMSERIANLREKDAIRVIPAHDPMPLSIHVTKEGAHLLRKHDVFPQALGGLSTFKQQLFRKFDLDTHDHLVELEALTKGTTPEFQQKLMATLNEIDPPEAATKKSQTTRYSGRF